MAVAKPARSSSSVTLFNIFARLVAWYSLYTVLFRCPTNLDANSPTLCHTARSIRTTLEPHVKPYYDSYVEPYVEELEPYVHKANANYLIPAYAVISSNYNQYAAPHITKGQKWAGEEYTRVVKPQVDVAKQKSLAYYKVYLGPHVKSVEEAVVAARPHAQKAQREAEKLYYLRVVPAYEQARPHVHKGIETGQHVLTTVVIPLAREAREKVYGYARRVWGAVISPQVGRIGERINGANNGSNPTALSSSLFASMSANGGDAKATASLSSMMASVSAAAAKAKAENADANPSKEDTRKIVEEDLETWRGKFARAAQKTSDDVIVEVQEIASKAQETKKAWFNAELLALKLSIDNNIGYIKNEITSWAKRVSEDEASLQEAKDALTEVIKSKAVDIRDKTQRIRTGSDDFLSKLYDDVAPAVEQHLEVLDSVLDVGMQEIGMKWAWIDHVTYKDWERYHALKKKFKENRSAVVQAVESDEKLMAVVQWGEDWQTQAEIAAQTAANDITTLKKVGQEKLEKGDYSHDFTEKPAEKVVGEDKKPETVPEEATEGTISHEDIPGIIIDADDVTEDAKAPSEAEQETEQAQEEWNAAKAQEQPQKVFGGVHAGFVAAADPIIEEDSDSLLEDLQERMSAASRAVSEALAGTPTKQPVGESISSVASEKYQSALDAAVGILYPTKTETEMLSVATDKYSAAVAAASSILYGTPTPKPELWLLQAKSVYDDTLHAAEDSYRSMTRLYVTKPENKDAEWRTSMKAVAEGAKTSALMAAKDSYSSAISAGEAASKQYQSAIEAAKSVYDDISILPGSTTQAASESMLSVAKEQYSSAIAQAQVSYNNWYLAASTGLLGTPTSTGYVAAATEAAEQRYLALKEMVEELVVGKEPDFTDSVYSRLSTAIYGTEPAFIARATEAVQDNYASASSIIAEQAAAVTIPPAVEAFVNQVQQQVQELVDQASVGVYGSEKGTWEKATDYVADASATAASYAADASAAASEAVYGKEPTGYEAVLARLDEIRTQAQEKAKELLYGPEPTGTDAVKASAASVRDAASDAATDAYDSVTSNVAGTWEIAMGRIDGVVEAARRRVAELEKGSETLKEGLKEGLEDVQSKVASATERLRDEL